MSSYALRVRELGKQYRIRGRRERHKTLRESLVRGTMRAVKQVGSGLRGQLRGAAGKNESVWALRELSFDLEWGEVLGIIGPNGAGKSTLLKILAGITEPTTGRAELYGRVGSLLEVGTGFHPELTGRENIYLSGAILGMTRAEIRRKFDQIVDFSGVGKYIDTPMKHFSSGMNVRLGFAVAAHLEPEILLIDEVLAVGDLAFQKKCLSKMGEVARGGRTVLFVSHNLAAVQELCSRAVLLDKGREVLSGTTEEVISLYLGRSAAEEATTVALPSGSPDAPGRGIRLSFTSGDGTPQAQFRMGERWRARLEFEIYRQTRFVSAALQLNSLQSVPLVTYNSGPKDLKPGLYQVEFEVNLPLRVSHLSFSVNLSQAGQRRPFYSARGVGHISIEPLAVSGQTVRPGDRDLLVSFQQGEIMPSEEERAGFMISANHRGKGES